MTIWNSLIYDFVKVFSDLPWLLVMVMGGVVCVFRLANHPRESWLVGAAIGLALFASVGVGNLSDLLQRLPGPWRFLMNVENPTLGTQLLFTLPGSILEAAAWGLILYAAFGEGSGPRSKSLVEDESSRGEET